MSALPKTLIFHHTGHLPDVATGHLQCVKIEIGGVNLWVWRLHASYVCVHMRVRVHMPHARSI